MMGSNRFLIVTSDQRLRRARFLSSARAGVPPASGPDAVAS